MADWPKCKTIGLVDSLHKVGDEESSFEQRYYISSRELTAMGTQPTMAQAIRNRGADYILAAKDNQPKLAESTARRTYISSLAPDAQHMNQSVRVHWRAENSLHWCMEAALADDQMRVCTDHAAHNLAVLRHFVLSLIRLAPVEHKGGLKVQRPVAATSDTFRAERLGLAQDSCDCPAWLPARPPSASRLPPGTHGYRATFACDVCLRRLPATFACDVCLGSFPALPGRHLFSHSLKGVPPMTTKEATKAATAVAGERHWVTFRFRSQQGIRKLSDPEAQRITGKDRSSQQHGLCENVAKGRSPEVAAIYPCR